MSKSREAIMRIRNVASAIEAEPERYDQREFVTLRTDERFDDERIVVETDAAWCNTAFCIAGWNHVLHHRNGAEPHVVRVLLYGAPSEYLCDFAEPDNDLVAEVARDFELSYDQADALTAWGWQPAEGFTVPQALRRIAGGYSVRSVTA